MKKTTFVICMMIAVMIIAFLTSCGHPKYTVLLHNNALVESVDNADRPYSVGDTVCVWTPDNNDAVWVMDTHGYMIEDASTRIGVIKYAHD